MRDECFDSKEEITIQSTGVCRAIALLMSGALDTLLSCDFNVLSVQIYMSVVEKNNIELVCADSLLFQSLGYECGHVGLALASMGKVLVE